MTKDWDNPRPPSRQKIPKAKLGSVQDFLSYDAEREIITIYGVEYTRGIFQMMAAAPAGAVWRFMRRDDDHMQVTAEVANADA